MLNYLAAWSCTLFNQIFGKVRTRMHVILIGLPYHHIAFALVALNHASIYQLINRSAKRVAIHIKALRKLAFRRKVIAGNVTFTNFLL
jgi:hypothetical protein